MRAGPLPASAIVGRGPAAIALAQRLLKFDQEKLAGFQGVAGDHLLILTGNESDLPWIDGIEYLGRDADAPSLLLPTYLLPNLPLQLVERAFLARNDLMPPIALLHQPDCAISLAMARRIDYQSLENWVISMKNRV